MLRNITLGCSFLLLHSCNQQKEVTYFVRFDKVNTTISLPSHTNNSVQDIARKAFGDSESFDTAVFNAKDTVDSTAKATSKLVIKRHSWGDYYLKDHSSVYYYKASN
jgi:hypothetical protein